MRRDPAAIIMYAKKARRSKPKRSPKSSVGEQKTKQKRHKKSAVMGIASTPNILDQKWRISQDIKVNDFFSLGEWQLNW